MTYYPEPGKDAITRDGRKVTQITVADDPSALYPVHGVLDGRALTWTEKGWFMSDESGDPRDLAGPWHDRIEKLEAANETMRDYIKDLESQAEWLEGIIERERKENAELKGE